MSSPETATRATDNASSTTTRASRVRRPVLDEAYQTLLERCRSEIRVGSEGNLEGDELAHYWYAQTERRDSQKNLIWIGYWTTMTAHLRTTQNPDGSWPVGDSAIGDPIRTAAVWCTVLQLHEAVHPSWRTVFADMD